MNVRTWLHGALTGHAPLMALLGEGPASVLQFRSFDNVPEEKPFIIHRMGLSVPGIRDGNLTLSMTTPIQVWIHDHPGSYLRIDAIAQEIRGLMENAVNAGDLIQAEWLEDSEDFNDPEMGTVLRFSRYQVIHTP